MKRYVMIWISCTYLVAFFLVLSLTGKTPILTIMRCCGIYRLNRCGTYDRFLLWGNGRLEMPNGLLGKKDCER